MECFHCAGEKGHQRSLAAADTLAVSLLVRLVKNIRCKKIPQQTEESLDSHTLLWFSRV